MVVTKDYLHELEFKLHGLCCFNQYENDRTSTSVEDEDDEKSTDWMEIEDSFMLQPLFCDYEVCIPSKFTLAALTIIQYYYVIRMFIGSLKVYEIRLLEDCHKEIWNEAESNEICSFCKKTRGEPAAKLLEFWEKGEEHDWPNYQYKSSNLKVFDFKTLYDPSNFDWEESLFGKKQKFVSAY
ncbi:hypothetical protein TKK_0005366 [Trichogramma kaykai]|uniref:Uncharacterized protein n=1 Tax=Trichogramma kaykai TaxID=54128 RepID=A0ABD2XID0_9HYME